MPEFELAPCTHPRTTIEETYEDEDNYGHVYVVSHLYCIDCEEHFTKSRRKNP